MSSPKPPSSVSGALEWNPRGPSVGRYRHRRAGRPRQHHRRAHHLRQGHRSYRCHSYQRACRYPRFPRHGHLVPGAAEGQDVGRSQRGRALQRRDELAAACAAAIGVVVEVSGAGVIDDAIVRVVAAGSAGGREEAPVARCRIVPTAQRLPWRVASRSSVSLAERKSTDDVGVGRARRLVEDKMICHPWTGKDVAEAVTRRPSRYRCRRARSAYRRPPIRRAHSRHSCRSRRG